MCQTTKKSSKDNKIQCLPSITIGGLFISAINGIAGFVAVYFFKPLWDRIVNLLKSKVNK